MTVQQNKVFKNGSGYADPTAYGAITAAEMFNPGDVYKIALSTTGICDDRYAVVVASDGDGYVSTIQLSDVMYNKGAYPEFEIPKVGRLYANPYRIRTGRNYVLNEYVCSMREQDFEAIKETIRVALRIPQIAVKEDQQEALDEVTKQDQTAETVYQKALQEVYDAIAEQAKRPQAEWIKMRASIDRWTCSNCGEEIDSTFMGAPRYLTCPMCDAKISGYKEVDEA